MSLADDIRHEVLWVDEERLAKHRACSPATRKFLEKFPDGTEITVERCVDNASGANSLNFPWAAEEFLNSKEYGTWYKNYNRNNEKYTQTVDRIYPLLDDKIITIEEYNTIRDRAWSNSLKGNARKFAELMIAKADRAVEIMTQRLGQLNNDELRYKILFVDADRLQHLGVCSGARTTFNDLFPNGVEITPELCVFHADKFDWSEAALKFLPPTGEIAIYEVGREQLRDTYNTAWNGVANTPDLTDWQREGRYRLLEDDFTRGRARLFGECMVAWYERLTAELNSPEETVSEDTETGNPPVTSVSSERQVIVVSELPVSEETETVENGDDTEAVEPAF